MTNRGELIQALAEYGRMIKRDGWKAGKSIIEQYECTIQDFRRWAGAFGIMLRAEELLAALA